MIGIYKIENTISGHFYIGSSNNILSRWSGHRSDLRKGTHHSKYLQRAWNYYGSESFIFYIIETCEVSELLKKEQDYIDTLGPEYNMSKDVTIPNPPQNRPILRISMNTGECTEYATRDLAAQDGYFNEGSITACCHGHMASHRGYFWKFADGSTPDFITTRISEVVSRFSLDGSYECTFGNISAAVKGSLGSTYRGIHDCCSGNLKTHNNYIWKFGPSAGDSVIVKSRRKKNVGRGVRRISVNSLDVFVYRKSSDVSIDGYSVGNVISCCEGHRNTHKGCFWEWADQPRASEYRPTLRSKGTIVGTSISGSEVRVYPDTTTAGIDGFIPTKISLCCLGRRKTHRGYTWRRL